MSFGEGNLRRARAVAPKLPRALLRRRVDGDPAGVAERLGLAGYFPRWAALAGHPAAIGQLHAAGVGVFAFTVDDPAGWRAASRAGVDGIITNRAGALVRSRRHALVAP